MARGLEKWLQHAPTVDCDWQPLEHIYRRCMTDLAALRFSTLTMPGRGLPAAGLPWFMTIFGRDSILTSLQALPFTSELASTTLLALAERQGTRIDDFRDEDPGRILHEMRYGEMTAFEERPHSPYYGNADATMLYVILLDEYERWTGDTKLVREPGARGQGGAELDRRVRRPAGQRLRVLPAPERRRRGWRTSAGRTPGTRSPTATAICPASRAPPASCRATPTTPRCAAPGWPGWCGRIRPTPTSWRRRPPTSSAGSTATSGSRTAEYFAVALDGDGRQVDSLTSNIGHLLWSGIVDASKAKAVVKHLMGPRLFSGWGVRTLAEGEARYNPIGYHVGTVWPFDNSFIAWGLRRYGFKAEAACIVAGILEAAEVFDGRLPEAFGGYARSSTMYPVQYPTACSPQAWSTGAPLLLLRAGLGLEPNGDNLDRRPGAADLDRQPRAAGPARPVEADRRLRARPDRHRPADSPLAQDR